MKRSRKHLAVEVTIVSVLIVLLIGISLPRFFKAQTSQLIARAITDMGELHQAFEAYFVDNQAYPPDFDSGAIPGANVPMMISEKHTYKCLTTPIVYMNPIPFDVFMLEFGAHKHKNPPHYEYAGPGVMHLEMNWQLSGTRWTIISLGPDLWSESSYNFTHNEAMLSTYNVSNGLVSRGDLYASNFGVIDPFR